MEIYIAQMFVTYLGWAFAHHIVVGESPPYGILFHAICIRMTRTLNNVYF